MIVTQGNEHDYECLRAVVKSDAAYIGVISSQAKKVKFTNRLKKLGIPAKFINRVRIPSGIDLGAQTPAEIADTNKVHILHNRCRAPDEARRPAAPSETTVRPAGECEKILR